MVVKKMADVSLVSRVRATAGKKEQEDNQVICDVIAGAWGKKF